MTDQPIEVHGTPTPVQIAAGLRQAVTVVGSIMSALGFSGAFNAHATDIVNIIGPASVVIAVVWGQYATWKHAKQAAIATAAAPDSVAVLK